MDFGAARDSLVEHLSAEIDDKRVLAAMAEVPRECFVSPALRRRAYEDRPLPIGLGQTISQPFIIALMTAALELSGDEKVLEIGTGSGYLTAILSRLARRVVSVERLPELARTARQALRSQGYTNIEIHPAGETLGWRKESPYQAIIVSAGAPSVPPVLIAQLAIGGRLVIPVGSRYVQELYKITRHRRENIVEKLGGCRFVSLIGRDAWTEEEE